MNKKLLLTLSLMAMPAIAMEHMELTELIMDQQAQPAGTTEQTVVIIIEEQEIKLPARYISLIGTLKNLRADLPESSGIPLPRVSLATWQRIEPQLERVYKNSQGDNTSDEILVDYRQLDSAMLIGLIGAVEYLDIPFLKEITLELAQDKLTVDEVLTLSADVRNELIKRKAFKIAGPVTLKELAVCRGHTDVVWGVCVTPDGKMIVSGSKDKTVRIWDMSGNQLVVCRGHTDEVFSVCVTPDNRIVSGSFDGTVRIWDMSGNQLAVCQGHGGPIRSVCVTQDNKIVSGSDDETVRIWDMSGNQLAVCQGHGGSIRSVCVTQDNRVVSGSEDKTVRIWDMSGSQLPVCRGHEHIVWSVYVTHDNRIVSGSADKTVRIWDMDGNQLACRGHETSVQSFSVTPDNRMVSACEEDILRIWEMKGQELAVCRGHNHWTFSVCVTQDNRIVSGSGDDTVRIWSMSGISLNNRLSSMNEKQAKLIDRVLKRTKSLLFELKADLSERLDSLQEMVPTNVLDDFDEGYLDEGIQGTTTKACGVVSKQCWQEIEEILEEKELEEAILEQPKKRKELENGESNPAKKVRLEEELVTEKKEQNHE